MNGRWTWERIDAPEGASIVAIAFDGYVDRSSTMTLA
jgi:hypothetical protein